VLDKFFFRQKALATASKMVLFSRGSIGVLRGGGAARRRRRRDARAAMHFLPGVLRESYL
jgi:hypothetical protein